MKNERILCFFRGPDGYEVALLCRLDPQWALSCGHQYEASCLQRLIKRAWFVGSLAEQELEQGEKSQAEAITALSSYSPRRFNRKSHHARQRQFTFTAERELKRSELNLKSRPTSSLRSVFVDFMHLGRDDWAALVSCVETCRPLQFIIQASTWPIGSREASPRAEES